MSKNIFDKQAELKPSAMTTVAERRFADAEALINTGKNAHANGAAYLAGFVIEILLKAQLVRKFPAIARKHASGVTVTERKVWGLIWRQHDLEAMLSNLAQLEAALKARGRRDGQDYLENLKKICATWTIHARYSSRTISMSEAKQIMKLVDSVKELLK
jgi:HEPN domain-containing protein